MIAPLPYQCHDGALLGVRLGPRRELILIIALAPPPHLGDHLVAVRFGGIANLDEVQRFFAQVHSDQPLPPSLAGRRVAALDDDPTAPSRVNRLVVRLVLDGHAPLTIRARTVTAWREDEERLM